MEDTPLSVPTPKLDRPRKWVRFLSKSGLCLHEIDTLLNGRVQFLLQRLQAPLLIV